jgi:hypothetical protein
MKLFFLYSSTALCIFWTSTVTGATLITFDDLPIADQSADYAVPVNYLGLQWTNFGYVDPIHNYWFQGATNGFVNGMVSPYNVAGNSFAQAATIHSASGTFDLNSAYLTGGWNDALNIRVQGYLGGSLIFDNTYVVDSTAPTFVNFNYLGVDTVTFDSYGGYEHHWPLGHGDHFVIDNLTVTVPEPGFPALALFGCLSFYLSPAIKKWIKG